MKLSVDYLIKTFNLNRNIAKTVQGILDFEVSPYPTLDNAGIDYNTSTMAGHDENILLALEYLLDGDGLDIYNDDDYYSRFWQNTVVCYVNMGDEYAKTIIYDTVKDAYCCCSIVEYLSLNSYNKG